MVDKFKTYTEYSDTPTTEKITLAHVHCKNRVYGFTQVDSSDVYVIETDHLVVGCQDGMNSLESVSSPGEVTSGKFHFDVQSSSLYVYSTNGFIDSADDPEIIPTYRLFYADTPINLSWDLSDNSEEVYYEPRLQASPGFKSKVDNSQMGISVTGSGTLKLNNGDLYFKDLYDLLIFENMDISIFSHHRSLNPSQAKPIYKGAITEKTYSSTHVSFKVKDVISSLEAEIDLGKFSEISDDINISPSVGTYVKRRLYGFFEKLRCQSVDMLYDANTDSEAYPLTSTVSGSLGSNILIGENFLSELSPEDSLLFGDDQYNIDSVISDTELSLSSELDKAVNNANALIVPTKPWSNTNRKFLICGHDLHNISTTVTAVIERNRVYVASTVGFKENDYVDVNGQYVAIKRISGNKFIFRQNLLSLPAVGTSITKEKIQKVIVKYPERKYKDITLVRGDYSVTETSEGSYLNIEEDAEKNATLPRMASGDFFFVKGFDVVWLGKPSMFLINCAAQNSGSLFGKFFTMRSNGTEVLCYFSKVVESDQDETEAPTFNYTYTALASTDQIYIAGTVFAEGTQISLDELGLPGGLTADHSYFIREVSGNYFKVSADANSKIKDITGNGGGNANIEMMQVEIPLNSDNMTSTEVAVEVSKALSSKLDAYLSTYDENEVTVYTKTGKDLMVGSAGTSGFSIQKIMVGKESDQAINTNTFIKVRDWLQGYGTGDNGYHEVLEVFDKSIRIRNLFNYETGFYKIQVKNVGYVNNDSHVYVDTSGKIDSSGDVISSAPYIVRDLLVEGGLTNRLDEDSFQNAAVDIPYELSIRIPYDIDDSAPEMREVINDINSSVLGSLVLVNDLDLAFHVLDVERTTQDLERINDDDIVSWTFKSSGSLYQNIKAKYRFTDIEDTNSSEYLYTSDFASKYNNSELTLSVDLHLYNQSEAEEAAQRRLFYNSLFIGDITVKGSINLSKHNMGDKVIVSLNGLYNRTGNAESNDILAVVSSVTITGSAVTLILTTQGANIFSKVAVITDDSRPDYDSATEEDKLYSSYIVGESGTINNRADLLNVNCIA